MLLISFLTKDLILNKELLEQIAQLRNQAQKLTEKIALDQQKIAKSKAQLEILKNQLLEQFDLGSWEEASELLAKYEQEIKDKLAKVRQALEQAGIDDL